MDTCFVKTVDGPIRGSVEKSDEEIYYKFKGIPYAKPPTGPLRFRPPCPVSPWTEEIDCTKDPPSPAQCICGKFNGSEDCLYIEVSTKQLTPYKPLPVMFWIGSYIYSSTIDHVLDSRLLNDHGVVFVRCGFRLGPLGFLSINEFTAPGNCGLKDIVMALKWVQRNIDKFGGDPDNVTLFGNSTGGSIVHLLMLSAMASGLFQKAIIQSASALNNWSIAMNPSQAVMELSAKLELKNKNEIELVEELRSIPVEDIMRACSDLQSECNVDNADMFNSVFKPCIEQEFEGLPAFLTKTPLKIIKTGNFNRVPLMIGSNNVEASVLQHIKSDFYDNFEKYNENVSLLVPKSILSQDSCVSKTIGNKLLKFYVGNEGKLTEDTRSEYLQMISDYYFLYYVNKTVKLHKEFAPECPLYYYVVSFASRWNMPKDFAFLNSLGHATELPFIFGIKTDDSQNILCSGSRESIITRSRVIKMWTNFSKYGNPTPDEDDPLLQVKWDPVENSEKLNYLSIGSELTKGRNPFQERMQFWEDLHNEYSFLRILAYFNDLGVK